MTPEPRTYDELAQNVLRDYLRSAVIIDDQWPEAAWDEPAPSDVDESELVEDRIPDEFDEEDAGDPPVEVLPPRPPENLDDTRLLAELQRSLLREGLLACGFRYTHQAQQVAIDLARRADIVVLDWHLVDDDGGDALAILEELRGNELRFVCIFTGHGRIEEVRRALEDRFREASSVPEVGEADLRVGNLVIAIRNKKGISEEKPGFTVDPGELLTETLRGLASNYNGLVQLAMLDLTQQHRRQLPAILERLDKSIDTAVLLEAGDESSPVGQSGAFLAVLVDEWRAHLEQAHSSVRSLGTQGLRLFGSRLAERLSKVTVDKMGSSLVESGVKRKTAEAFAKKSTTGRGYERLREWLDGGCCGAIPAVHGGDLREDVRLAGWGALRAVSGTAEDSSLSALLRLDALFHQQFEQPERLTQGALVATGQDSDSAAYYLCITPVCDAERPDNLANLFTFLRTGIVPPEELLAGKGREATYCVIQDGEGLLCLEAFLKQRIALEVTNRTFDSKGTLRARFPPADGRAVEPLQLRRVAQLRAEHALSITAATAADASRVGVNRVELIRRRLS